MAFEVCAIAIGLLVGWWKKGSVWNIANVTLRFVWLLPIGYLVQTYSIAHLTGTEYRISLLFSYLAILTFCIINFRRSGIPWTAIGTGANFICMLFNGLRMPAYIPAVKAVSPSLVPLLNAGKIGKSVAMTTQTHLNFLGDIFTWRIHPITLISIGDILFGVGITLFIQHAMCSQKGEQEYRAGHARPA